MFPRPREARKVILLAGAATGNPTAGAGRAVGQNGSLAKVLRGCIGLRRCASPARVVGIKCSRKRRQIEPGRGSEQRIGALGGQAPRSKKRSPVSPLAGSSWMFGRPSRGQ